MNNWTFPKYLECRVRLKSCGEDGLDGLAARCNAEAWCYFGSNEFLKSTLNKFLSGFWWIKLFCDVWVEVFFFRPPDFNITTIYPNQIHKMIQHALGLSQQPVQVNAGRLLRAQAKAVAAELSKIHDAWSKFLRVAVDAICDPCVISWVCQHSYFAGCWGNASLGGCGNYPKKNGWFSHWRVLMLMPVTFSYLVKFVGVAERKNLSYPPGPCT